MCSIAGMINFQKNYLTYPAYNRLLVREMASSMRHRGPDASGEWVGEHAAFSHTRLAVIDPEGGALEMIIHDKGEIGGPLNQFSTIGYKFETNGATILYPERMLRVMSVSSFSATDEVN